MDDDVICWDRIDWGSNGRSGYMKFVMFIRYLNGSIEKIIRYFSFEYRWEVKVRDRYW